MPVHYDFKKDLPIARKTETEISELLCKTYSLKYYSGCNDNRWDLDLTNKTGKHFTFEVKEDFTHGRTGNVGVEFFCREKPSGISVSKADYYVYKLHEKDGSFHVYIIKTSVFKKMIDAEMYDRTIDGGDKGSHSLNYLFIDTVFYQYAKKIV